MDLGTCVIFGRTYCSNQMILSRWRLMKISRFFNAPLRRYFSVNRLSNLWRPSKRVGACLSTARLGALVPSYFCAEFSSRFQQRIAYLSIKYILQQYAAFKVFKIIVIIIRYECPTDTSPHHLSVFWFSDLGQVTSHEQTPINLRDTHRCSL